MGRRPPPPNAAGVHFLRSRSAAHLVHLAAPGPDDLVLDLGAGLGALTVPLATTGARVLAVERDEGYVRYLRNRFAGTPRITVVAGDLLVMPLPRRDFRVVANIPFGTTAGLLRRLLDPPGPALLSAHLVVRRDAARQIVARSRSGAGAWWGARFDLRHGPTLSRNSFVPPPTVDAEILTIRRVPFSRREEEALRAFLRAAARQPHRSVRALLAGRLGPGQLRALGLDPGQQAATVDAAGWRAVTCGTRANLPPRRPPPTRGRAARSSPR